jgi:hypothetical protein
MKKLSPVNFVFILGAPFFILLALIYYVTRPVDPRDLAEAPEASAAAKLPIRVNPAPKVAMPSKAVVKENPTQDKVAPVSAASKGKDFDNEAAEQNADPALVNHRNEEEERIHSSQHFALPQKKDGDSR